MAYPSSSSSKLREYLESPSSCQVTRFMGREAYNGEDEHITVPITSIPYFIGSEENLPKKWKQHLIPVTPWRQRIPTRIHLSSSPLPHYPVLSNQVAEQETIPTPFTQPVQPSNSEEDIVVLAEFPKPSPNDEYYTEDEYSEEEGEGNNGDDNAEMPRDPTTEAVKETLEYILSMVCENEEPNGEVEKDDRSDSPFQADNDSSSEDSVSRASCIQWIGKRKAHNSGIDPNLQDKKKKVCADPSQNLVRDQDPKNNNGTPLGSDNLVTSVEVYKSMRHVQGKEGVKKKSYKTQRRRQARKGCSSSSSNTITNGPAMEIQRHLQIPFNPMRPCCWHPCCIFMRELIRLMPWWRAHYQFEDLLKIYYAYCQIQIPIGFTDPPESEWTVAKVYHVNPTDGTLRYKCKNCEGTVEHRSSKRKRLLNFGRLNYECGLCHRKYITRRQLRLHSMRHSKKTHACVYCDKLFLTQGELQNHINTHTGEKPFCCPICFQKFAHSSRYYGHIRMFHKRYDCEGCFYRTCAAAKADEGN
ncbi:Zinc-responsive transcriptional regulator ZAP1 [Orchesella cincta]|uniref:Zinc-responsive transcriptional regulator ZAP1 n=1 Tax=Orchesella cincta TaxID=48709 RepID=A0A1D2N7B1_ORCCI|nr:Zinc-responsive transcriptional regulator ZAP1 [Orchesella cincta]